MAIPYCCQKKFIDIDLLLFIAIYIQHMNNIQLLKEWKKKNECKTPEFQHLYSMNDDLFSYMLEFL